MFQGVRESPAAALWEPGQPTDALDATIPIPGSKSLTNRYLILAALADQPSHLRQPLRARDTQLMVSALRVLGADIVDHAEDWTITPGPVEGGGHIHCGLAGTVMRFTPALAALASNPVRFDGDAQARNRPMGPALKALSDLGATVTGRDTLPFTVAGQADRRVGGSVRIDASASSQFISGLLLAGSRYDKGLTLVHTGPPPPSQPHLAMTIHTIREAGGIVDDSQPNIWTVEPGPLTGLDITIEPDLSNAAPFLAAALIAGGQVRIPHWPTTTTQAGDAIRDILSAMGAQIFRDGTSLIVEGNGTISGLDIDLHAASELTPIIAALAALADKPSTIRGVGHIRGHETDRITALARELTRIGIRVDELHDGLRITPGPTRRPAVWHTYADHRMVMAGALLALATPGLRIKDPETVAKTLPAFPDMWANLLTG